MSKNRLVKNHKCFVQSASSVKEGSAQNACDFSQDDPLTFLFIISFQFFVLNFYAGYYGGLYLKNSFFVKQFCGTILVP